MVLFYWGFLTGVVFLAGAFLARQLVTGPSGADVCMARDRGRCFGEISISVIFLISLLTFVLNLIHLYLHASVMTDTPLRETGSIMHIFLLKTKYGRLGLLRTLFLIPLILLIFACMRSPRRWKALTGAVFAMLLLISISMSSHQAKEGYMKLPLYLDVLHISSISIWIGGIFFIRFCYSFFIRDEGREFQEVFRRMITRFSDIATWAVYTAGVSGLILVFIRIKGLAQLTGTPYGMVLIAKVIIASIIFLLGGLNKFYLLPRLFSGDGSSSEGAVRAKKMLYLCVTAEAGAGMVVMLLTALLTHLSPVG